jgi:hypothetical protein
MLHNLWYQNITSLLDYISELPELSQDGKRVSVLCPDPSTADKLREKLGEGFLVQTISAGLKGLMNDNSMDSMEIYRKSDLIFELWIAWKKFGMKESFHLFNNCFNLVTELRGYSTNTNQVIDLLKEANEELFKGVCFLLHYYQERELHDENSIYENLAKTDIDFGDASALIIYGFKHLSANQIDMLVNFSKDINVYFPLPKGLKDHLSFSDWPSWLRENGEDTFVEGGEQKTNINIVKANNYLASQYVHEQLKNQSIDQLYFWDRNEVNKKTSELSSSYVQFKKSIDIFRTEVKWLEDNLNHEVPCSVDSIFEFLENEFNAEKSNKFKNYRKIKVLYEFFECLKSFQVYGIEDITAEDLNALLEKTRLDLPRNSLVNIGQHGNVCSGTFSDALIDGESRKLFVLSEDLNFDINQNMDDELLSSLSSLGPIRNINLDLLFSSLVLECLDSTDEVTLVISPEIFEKTILFDAYKDLQSNRFEKHNILEDKELSVGQIAEPLEKVRLSPSKLQKFIDCPYQFYLSRIEELNGVRSIESDYLAAETGTLSHDVLAEIVPLFLQEKAYDLDAVIDQEIQKLEKKLVYEFRHQEIKQNCESHIEKVLNEFKKIRSGEVTSILPEETFKNDDYKGILDLFLKSKTDEWFVFDYKKSDGSIPNKTDVLKAGVVQLTLYSKFFDINKAGILGYICLEKPHKSMFYYNPDSVHAEWIRQQEFYSSATWTPITLTTLNEIHDEIDTRREDLFNTTEFRPLPRKNDVCTYCDYGKFCTGAIDDSE